MDRDDVFSLFRFVGLCGLDLHLLHYIVTVGFDGPFGTAYRSSDLLVGFAANDKLKDFPLTWRQSANSDTYAVQFVFQIAQCSVVR